MSKLQARRTPLAATRRVLLGGALVCGLALQAWAPALAADPAATAFDLVTEEEAQRAAAAATSAGAAAAPQPRSRGVPQPPGPGSAPAIEVVTPAGEATVNSPLRLEVRFRPAPGARIVPDSFRLLYGLLKIDLTERLQRQARLSERGVVVEGARMPQGTHRLLLRVADDQGRMAEQAVVFHVARRP
ncbi:MAG: hypothetical protein Q7U73_07440 [Rubrivivax sp.]|nr:hypothetical protein [Rubrivivax sp.]